MNTIIKKISVITVLISALILNGCGYDTLYSKLDEQQANEMLALLLRAGIEARKNFVDKEWALQVVKDDLPVAVDILKTNGYPRDNYQSLGDVFKKEGFVSSPLEERARLLYALSQELSKTVSAIDGVVVARVHLAIPEKEILSDERKPSSASIFIKYSTNSQVISQVASIKALVVNSVEGLPYDNVTVTLFPAESKLHNINKTNNPVYASIFNAEILKEINKNHIAAVIALLFILIVFLWFVIWQLKRLRLSHTKKLPASEALHSVNKN